MQYPTTPERSASQLQQIDEICNAFEAALKAEQAPVAEDFLAKADLELRSTLLPELIQLELHYHPNRSHDDLTRRFPDLDRTWLEGLAGSEGERAYPSIPGYFITEELGRGGMGVVYRAADLNLHRHVALKMIHGADQVSPEHRRRFLGEARAVARLHHPNLVQVFDSGEFEGHPYLVFELVEGGTLAERIRDEPLSCRESAELMETIGLALQFAHDRHVIHRDLKPSNILLGDGEVPQVSDFGLAKLLDDERQDTLSGIVVGTPSYMAPEQAVGLAGASSPAVDVYSLGAILYELLTGRPPFNAASVVETLDLLRTAEPTRPREIDSTIPRDLETICLKCLQKEPTRRYISAQVFAEELGRYRRGEAIIARPVGSIERIGRWCRCHPLPASLAATLILAVVVGFAAVSWQWGEAVNQRTLALQNALKFQTERDRAITATARAETSAADAVKQRAIAERHRKAADSRFEKAQAAVQELIRIGTELVRQPQMEAQGQQALEKASQFRRALLEERSDDPEVKFFTAQTLGTLAWTLLEHGQFSDAERTFQETLKLLREVHAVAPDSRGCVQLLRNMSLHLSVTLFRQQQYRAAEVASRQSVAYAEQLADQNPEDLWSQNGLGNTLANRAVVLVRVGQREQAVGALRRSVDIHRELAEKRPDVTRFRVNLALVLGGLAEHLWAEEREAAEVLAVEALEIRRLEAERADEPRDEAMYVMSSLLQLSTWYAASDRSREAEILLTEAIDYGKTSRALFPGFFGTRQLYVNAMAAARRLALRQGDAERAESLLQDLRRETPEVVADFPQDVSMRQRDAWHRHEWGLLLAKRGEPKEGMELVMSSLRDLQQLQTGSSTPEQLRIDIMVIAHAAIGVGKRFEFERDKLEAMRDWAAQSPNDSKVHNALARRQLIVKDESLRDPVVAEKSVRRALELNADDADYLNTLGIALYYQDQFEEAAAVFRTLAKREVGIDPTIWCFLAMIHGRQEDQGRVRELFELAVAGQKEHQPDNEELQLLLNEVSNLIETGPTSGGLTIGHGK